MDQAQLSRGKSSTLTQIPIESVSYPPRTASNTLSTPHTPTPPVQQPDPPPLRHQVTPSWWSACPLTKAISEGRRKAFLLKSGTTGLTAGRVRCETNATGIQASWFNQRHHKARFASVLTNVAYKCEKTHPPNTRSKIPERFRNLSTGEDLRIEVQVNRRAPSPASVTAPDPSPKLQYSSPVADKSHLLRAFTHGQRKS